jgi:hypothetical protein
MFLTLPESAGYAVYFDAQKGEITYNSGSLSEFQQFQPGSIWTPKLNAVGGALSVGK